MDIIICCTRLYIITYKCVCHKIAVHRASVCVCVGGGGAREVRVRGERTGVCVCVLSCLLCFIVGSLYNGSRNGVSHV